MPTTEQPPAPRQCGRCRVVFPGDPALDAAAQAAWWLCPPCRVSLYGDESRLAR